MNKTLQRILSHNFKRNIYFDGTYYYMEDVNTVFENVKQIADYLKNSGRERYFDHIYIFSLIESNIPFTTDWKFYRDIVIQNQDFEEVDILIKSLIESAKLHRASLIKDSENEDVIIKTEMISYSLCAEVNNDYIFDEHDPEVIIMSLNNLLSRV